MRKPFICANWKMNKTANQAQKLIDELLPLVKNAKCEIAVCPPYTTLWGINDKLSGSNIALGAQNINQNASGAFTGEVSADMLREIGVDYVIIGHSERRQYYNETDETVSAKVKVALANEIKPIICVGESLAQRESDETFAVLDRQVNAALEGIVVEDAESIVFAYEPIWAIGTGKTASAQQANDAIGHIRAIIAAKLSKDAADSIRILYGGSMNEKNVKELMAMEEIDGGLIGSASLNAKQFAELVCY